ncbi:MAG: hypothetical protein JW888_11425 [Pirellulales bacterium]|nr:hypothetical protein [Pirellulales bacterium]
MPIRFACQACGRLLSTARRKRGTSIDCPKCGHAQIVPDPSAPADSLPRPVDLPDQSIGAVPNEPAETDSTDNLVPPEMVLVSRRAIYAQGLLLVVVGVVGLLAGCLIGRGCAPVDAVRPQDAAPSDRVLVEGKLTYRPVDTIEGDENAVAIFLPKNAKPSKRIGTPGIRPADSPVPSYSSLRAIRALGGAYARADRNGDFSVVLSRGGKYYLLIVSANTRRPDDDAIEPTALEELDSYFRRPEYLIGRQKCRWTLETLSGYARIEHDFGRNGRL